MSRSIFAPRFSRLVTYSLLALAPLTGAGCTRQLEPPKPDAPRSPEAAGPTGAPRVAEAPKPADARPPEAPRPADAGKPPEPPKPPDNHGEPDRPIAAEERAAVIKALTTALDQHYVFADKAKALTKALRGRLERGEYDSVATAQALVHTLVEDMTAIVHDKHLVVGYEESPIPPFTDKKPPELEAEEAAEHRYLNQGIFEVRRMRFNIGYLNFNAFGRPKAAADKLAAAMRLVNDTQGLIIDLRECRGGDPETVTLAESYLVPAKTHLLDMYTRATNVTEHVYAKAALGAPRYAADKPVFVLIGEATVSGCEAFAYAMQAQKRAIVIGSHSAGAAYFGDPRRLTEHFMAFIPIGRPIDPITHGDWEGGGVIPDVPAAPTKALEVAELKTLQALEPREPSKRRKAQMQKRMSELN